MSLPLKTSDAAPTFPLYRLTEKELKLRFYFLAAFNDVAEPDWAMQLAVDQVTDEMRDAGASIESVIKRVKYIAAIPIAFHYRFGYAAAQSRLSEAVAKAEELSVDRYFEATND
jgi:Asp-tRNA(Asn)/Glu-tRNA(Gln) amidotransferase A subunit family amidase